MLNFRFFTLSCKIVWVYIFALEQLNLIVVVVEEVKMLLIITTIIVCAMVIQYRHYHIHSSTKITPEGNMIFIQCAAL